MVTKTGIRWSELNRLEYWDTVGIMQNWFEGILQNHFRNQWMWDFEKLETKKTKTNYTSSEDNCEMEDGGTSGKTGLSWEQGHNMVVALSNVIVPLGVTCIPKWLGQAKEGKIKESEWKSLFSIYLPLEAVNKFIEDIENYANKPSEVAQVCLLVENFCALVVCTHILEARLISNFKCVRFSEEY
ncbi:hypothetical protein O181_017856 [Austropuccinia psidii MF-1]|uniref:Uncharacterized protein n=1 Tax=Austropuccinia psidii MF-1 TaxID=1389203 RepID=A0A9Q3C458_9BASI|nr:hypothetical protein [Austropuccinia psidii MF-1]